MKIRKSCADGLLVVETNRRDLSKAAVAGRMR
jgi:hypothetical protein